MFSARLSVLKNPLAVIGPDTSSSRAAMTASSELPTAAEGTPLHILFMVMDSRSHYPSPQAATAATAARKIVKIFSSVAGVALRREGLHSARKQFESRSDAIVVESASGTVLYGS
jgi:hypothetical protein